MFSYHQVENTGSPVMQQSFVYVFHILFVFPSLATIAFMNIKQMEVAGWVYKGLLGVSIVGFLYHLYRLFVPRVVDTSGM